MNKLDTSKNKNNLSNFRLKIELKPYSQTAGFSW